MELAKLIFDFISKSLWPVITFTVILIFRKNLKVLIAGITKLKAGGVELTVDQVKEIAKETAKKASEEVIKEELRNQEVEAAAATQFQQVHQDGASTMLAFAAGTSFNLNLKYNIYYDPGYRRHAYPFAYIGLYKEGEVRLVGKLSKIVHCDYKDGKLEPTYGDDISHLTQDEINRIKDTIEETKYYDLREDTKFFLVDQFYETHFDPETVIRAKKYFWLTGHNGFKPGMGGQELAKLLSESHN